MSAAEKWAESYGSIQERRPKGHSFREAGGNSGLASVADDGRCIVCVRGVSLWLHGDQAIGLAQWILRTFGEVEG